MKCRLKQNVIVGGQHIPFGTVIDDGILPERLKIDTVIAYDLDDREGKVLALHDISFQTIPKPGPDGVPVSYPVHVMAGALLDLGRVPAHHRASLKEGSDYATKWTLEEQKLV